MGLDMFLYRKSWVNNGDFYKPEYREKIKMTRGGEEIDTSNIRFIIEEVGYWRKANQIHKWFVDNIQYGNDDCGEYPVEYFKLEKLRDICETVLKEIKTEKSTELAEKVLPTQSGFFFGGTEYDEWYQRDLEYTINLVNKLLKEDSKGTLTYQSSW